MEGTGSLVVRMRHGLSLGMCLKSRPTGDGGHPTVGTIHAGKMSVASATRADTNSVARRDRDCLTMVCVVRQSHEAWSLC
jgi:hypothetical protein